MIAIVSSFAEWREPVRQREPIWVPVFRLVPAYGNECGQSPPFYSFLTGEFVVCCDGDLLR
ncbi:hypothetical protein [Chloroflexus islandicus]|uniref:hypothetical protein n=1 Tax=Chloroflexus islandicus TaxID=1707952 RepID=UPI0012E874E2|nr:hypothetical protein [Chloroflexus islandicus]